MLTGVHRPHPLAVSMPPTTQLRLAPSDDHLSSYSYMVYELVETFKKEQASVEVTVTQLSSGSGLLDEV